MWCPETGVVLGCIDSWFLFSSLLCYCVKCVVFSVWSWFCDIFSVSFQLTNRELVVCLSCSCFNAYAIPLDRWALFRQRKSQTNLPSHRDLLERAFMRVLSFDTSLTNKRVTILRCLSDWQAGLCLCCSRILKTVFLASRPSWQSVRLSAITDSSNDFFKNQKVVDYQSCSDPHTIISGWYLVILFSKLLAMVHIDVSLALNVCRVWVHFLVSSHTLIMQK